MRINVSGVRPEHTISDLEVDLDAGVEGLRRTVAERIGAAPERLRLIHMGRLIDESRPLGSFLHEGATIHAVITQGAPPPSDSSSRGNNSGNNEQGGIPVMNLLEFANFWRGIPDPLLSFIQQSVSSMVGPTAGRTPVIIQGGIMGSGMGAHSMDNSQQQQQQQQREQEPQSQQQQQQQQQQQAVPRWRASHSYTLKNNEKLNSHELAFDVSAHFASVPEVVEALNNRSIYWPAEYCVAHNVILASDNVGPGDKRVMLRRYAREYKNSAALLSQMFLLAGSIHCSPNTGANVHSASQEVATEKSPWLKRVVAMSNHTKNESNGEDTPSLPSVSRAVKREEELRSRIWDASWCTVIYQVTPREMKFNITSVVGIGKDNLNEAIQWLNLRSQPKAKAPHGKENPLQNYAYDYALLFSTEHQGYYLIAATHVPCDIVACRAAA